MCPLQSIRRHLGAVGEGEVKKPKKDRINILGSVWEQKSKKRVVVVRC